MSRAATLPLEASGAQAIPPGALPQEVVLVPQAGPAQVLALMTQALRQGIPVESIKEIAALYREEQDRAAAREFADAMAQFQAECPPIQKTASTQAVGQQSGTKFSFTYAPLDVIAATVGPHLHKHGLAYSWDTDATEKGIVCTATLRHRNGHSVSAKFACPTDSSLSVGSQQKFGAALTYARRYSLVQVLGLTTTDPDVETESPNTIGPQQEALLAALLDEVGADVAKFKKWLGIESLADMRESDYARAINALEQKRRST